MQKKGQKKHIVELMTKRLILLHALQVLPPLFTLYPGSDWVYGSSGFIFVNKKKEPVHWRWYVCCLI